jgi:L-threonylcarbamoyladenylate synthase
MAEVLDWRADPDPNALLQRLAELLHSGGVLALPTEAGYLFVASALRGGLPLLREFRPDEPPQLATGGPDEVVPWLKQRGRVTDRLMRRLWPGLATLSVPVGERDLAMLPQAVREQLISPDGRIRLGCFGHSLYQNLLMYGVGPLAFVEPGAGEDLGPETLRQKWGDRLVAILDDGTMTSKRTTRVSIIGEGWSIERHGEVAEEEVLRAAARWFVFVCTGNTCRSPMAEGLFQARLAEGLKCRVADLPAKGYNVLSAGVATYGGDAAALDAIETASGFGADLSRHRSRAVTDRLVQAADHLIAMTRNHLMALLARHSPQGTMQLLCGSEGDLDDPIGGGADVYRECGRTILRHVDRLISEYQLI